jgi:hypothetical protein
MDRFRILKGEQPPPPQPFISPFLIRYRAVKKVTDHCGIIPDQNGRLFIENKVHFFKKENGKYLSFLCKNDLCCRKLGPPKQRIGTVLIKYGSNLDAFDILPWIFGEGTYRNLKIIDEEFSLVNHDVIITCTNEEFQVLSFIPCFESRWQKYMNVGRILNEAEPIRTYLKRGMAADLSEEKISNYLLSFKPGPPLR